MAGVGGGGGDGGCNIPRPHCGIFFFFHKKNFMKYFFGGTWIIWGGETWMTSYMVKLIQYTGRCIVVEKVF